MRGSHTNFPQGDGNAAGGHSPGQNSHRGGNCIKALHTISGHQAPMGNAAGLTPWLDKCPGRNCIKAAHSFLRRFWQRSHQAWTRRMTYEKTAESKALATIWAGVSDMTMTRCVSNLNGGGLCA